jgi:hypothetical protein
MSKIIRKGMKKFNVADGFPDEIPNAETRAAIAELDAGGGIAFDTLDEMMAYLNSDIDEKT